MFPIPSPSSARRLAWKRRTYVLASINAACFLALALTLPAWRQAPHSSPGHEHSTPPSELRATRGVPARRLQAAARGQGFWSARGANFVDAGGNVVRFSGVIWFGFETPHAVVGGLGQRSYADHLDQMQGLGFNMIRLPFAGETLLATTFPADGTIDANPDLKGLTSLQVMDKIICECAKRGIKVILDYHRMHLTWGNEIGTWWDADTPESVWLDNWAMLAERYKGISTIVGADLFNEVHPNKSFPYKAPYWTYDAGENEKYNFRSATLRAIKRIHSIEPGWMIFMEGMWNGPYWWGGNCAKLLEAPIKGPKDKLAYTAHDYGPYVARLNHFFDPDFPDNLVPKFRYNWGQIIERGVAPLFIGEFGSPYPPNDSNINFIERTVFEHQIRYIGQIEASWTIAFWNPGATDTGSILNDDGMTVNEEKMALLKPIMYPGFL